MSSELRNRIMKNAGVLEDADFVKMMTESEKLEEMEEGEFFVCKNCGKKFKGNDAMKRMKKHMYACSTKHEETEEDEEDQIDEMGNKKYYAMAAKKNVYAKISRGENLTPQEEKMVGAAIDASKSGDDKKDGPLDKVMSKVSQGESLSKNERKILQSALKASK